MLILAQTVKNLSMKIRLIARPKKGLQSGALLEQVHLLEQLQAVLQHVLSKKQPNTDMQKQAL